MKKKNNIVLIGMRGSGKSTVGRLLAEKTEKAFYDTDAEIEKKWGKTIPQIVADEGWEGFREKESLICKEMGEKENAVIATGGGVVLYEKNMEHLKKNGICIFLFADIGLLADRIKNSVAKRPSLTGKSIDEELQNIWSIRKPLYHKAADVILSSNASSKKTAEEILLVLKKYLVIRF
jgi:shikimate kinase